MKICVAGQGAFGQKHLDALKRIPDAEIGVPTAEGVQPGIGTSQLGGQDRE